MVAAVGALFAMSAAQAQMSAAQPDARPAWHPSTVYAQAGFASDVRTAIAGVTWDWDWRREFARGVAGGYWELSVGQWQADGPPRSGSAFVTQLGVTPTIRLRPHGDSRWFFEAGIGANVLMPVYRSESKRFSTAFNFGDHIGIGRRFGADGRQELSLRLQHFSNAGIKHPNPGENFIQLRYAVRL
jgi:hypothetical protein